jgi:hypothetical protein
LEVGILAKGGARKELPADVPEGVPKAKESQDGPEAVKEGRNPEN